MDLNWNNYLGAKSKNTAGMKTTRFYIRTCPHDLPLPLATSPGWAFVSLCIIVSFCYLVPAMAYKRKKTGAAGMAALPHRTQWLQLYGLVLDGCQLCRHNAKRIVAGDSSGVPASSDGVVDAAEESSNSSTASKSSKSKKVAKDSRRTSKSGSKGKTKHSSRDKQKKGAKAEPLLANDAVSVAASAEQQRMLEERRDQTVHSSMAKVEVFTM